MPSCQWRGDRVLGSCVPLHICSYPGRSSLSSILWSSYHGRSTLSLSYHHQHYQHHHHTRGHNLKYEALGDLPFAEISWSSILNDIIMIRCHLIGGRGQSLPEPVHHPHVFQGERLSYNWSSCLSKRRVVFKCSTSLIWSTTQAGAWGRRCSILTDGSNE